MVSEEKPNEMVTHCEHYQYIEMKLTVLQNPSFVLRAVRDQDDAHPKTSAYAHSFKDMCALLNRFRSGIAGLLLDLCIHFGEKQVPTTVIRRAYLPKIRYVAQNS